MLNLNKFDYFMERKTCILMPLEDFNSLVSDTLPNIEVETTYEGLQYIDYKEDRMVNEDEVCEALSKILEVKVTSIHIDDYDYPGVWIVYN